MRNLRGAHHRRDRRVAVSWIEDDDDALKGASIYIYISFIRFSPVGKYSREWILCKIEIAINPFRRREEEGDYITTFICSESREGVR